MTKRDFKYVFSVLYNEGPDYLQLLVRNFLLFTTEDCALVINLGPDSAIADMPRSHRVFSVGGTTKRSAYGATLIAGHMEAFRYAEANVGDFDWFITSASNSLFYRDFEPDKAIVQLMSPFVHVDNAHIDDLPSGWHWPKFQPFQATLALMRERWGISNLTAGQIEGRMAARSDWAFVSEVQSGLADGWDGLGAPLEEVLPLTVMNALGSGRSTIICHMFWSRYNDGDGRYVRLSDMLDPDAQPPHVSMLKWFRREAACLESLMVSTTVGRSLLRSLRGEDDMPPHLLKGILDLVSEAVVRRNDGE